MERNATHFDIRRPTAIARDEHVRLLDHIYLLLLRLATHDHAPTAHDINFVRFPLALVEPQRVREQDPRAAPHILRREPLVREVATRRQHRVIKSLHVRVDGPISLRLLPFHRLVLLALLGRVGSRSGPVEPRERVTAPPDNAV